MNRWDYRTASDISHIMRQCARAGFTTVMFQVRGNGTALYSSRQEVWSEQFDFKAPTFDPLSRAVVAAHANGLKIHAWINVLPGWRGDKPPKDQRQLFHTRPEWFLQTAEPRSGIVKEGSYFWLNPCLPDVRSYLATICWEIADDYEVDGIHLDYIRFPGDAPADAPSDPASRRLFRRERGVDPEQDRAAFARWKQESVTRLVLDVRQELSRLLRPVSLTVAVIAGLTKTRTQFHQDWPVWVRHGAVDAVLPMAYADDDELFGKYVRSSVTAAGSVPVIAGVGAY
ncbi:MAG: glycoside hydrolase family 10 protein, partial [Planctomycetota bacterium]